MVQISSQLTYCMEYQIQNAGEDDCGIASDIPTFQPVLEI